MALVTRQGPSTLPNDTNPNNMTPKSVMAMIDQALTRNSTKGDGSHRIEDVVGLTRWIKKMESDFQISGCVIENQEVLKKKMTDKYCPQGKIKKLEIELWNLKVKGNNVPAYTEGQKEQCSSIHNRHGLVKKMSRLILCSKAQEYMAKGCQIFLAHIFVKKEEYRSEGKQLEDVPFVWDYPEVFPKDLPGLPPTRPVEFHIDLIPGAAHVARAPYRLLHSK
nr:putative reverse transcriptase domain-containing protein [Tanacetum cinerariifolium]